MTAKEVLNEIKAFGNEQTRKTLIKHGAPEICLGVKVQDLKKIQKKVKKNHALALQLYDTAVPDAMYLAGLIADENEMDSPTLEKWLRLSNWQMLTEYTIPWIAADSGKAIELGLKWITSNDEKTASAGWASLSSYLAVTPDESIDHKVISQLLDKVENEIDNAPARVKYTMNGFIIATGSYVSSLNKKALQTAGRIGKFTIDMKGTACKVPEASVYINKVIDKGYVGKKRKMARC